MWCPRRLFAINGALGRREVAIASVRDDELWLTYCGRMRLGRAALVAATVAAAACGSQTRSSTGTATRAHAGQPFALYTHCGIEWAKIGGTFWRAKRLLSDGSGNPPVGWGNPFQEGTLAFISPTTARLDSSAGSVTFERTSRKRPPMLCA